VRYQCCADSVRPSACASPIKSASAVILPTVARA
jgi:hypothetical protein